MTEAEARVIQAAQAWRDWKPLGHEAPHVNPVKAVMDAVDALRLERNPPPVRHTVEWRSAKAGERSILDPRHCSSHLWGCDSVAPAWVIVDDPGEPQ